LALRRSRRLDPAGALERSARGRPERSIGAAAFKTARPRRRYRGGQLVPSRSIDMTSSRSAIVALIAASLPQALAAQETPPAAGAQPPDSAAQPQPERKKAEEEIVV